MFTLHFPNGIIKGMKYVLTTFVAAIAVAVFALFAAFSPVNANDHRYAYAEGSAVKTSADTFSYGYTMSTPVAAVCFGGHTYILDGNGNVSAYADGYSPVDKTVIKNGNAPYDKIAVNADGVHLYGSDTAAAFVDGDALYVVKADSVSLTDTDGTDDNYVLPESGNTFVAGCASDGVLYLIEYSEASDVNSLWSFDGTSKTKLENELACNGDINGAAVTDSGEIYYSTLYSVYSVSLSESINNIGGGITSLSADEDALVYALTSGKICKYENGVSETLVAASGKISLSSRRNMIAVADKGNNALTVFRDGSSEKITVAKPEAVAIGYVGNIFVASDKYIIEYGADLKETDRYTVADNTSVITDICIDRAAVRDDTIYALASDGTVYSADGALASGAIAVTARPDGGFYALLSDGSTIFGTTAGTETENALPALEGAIDIAVDRAGNVYRLTDSSIYKNDSGAPVYEKEGTVAFEISECEFVNDGYAVGFGDIMTVDPDLSATGYVQGEEVGTDMKNGAAHAETYETFEAPYDAGTPDLSDHGAEIRKTEIPAEIYPCPVEMPSVFPASDDNVKTVSVSELPVGSFVTVIAQYEDTDFYYVIAENRTDGESTKGYMNIKTLGEPEEYDGEAQKTAYVKESTPVKKYPSVSAPDIDGFALTINSSCTVMPFCEDYTDAFGNKWYRIAYEYENEIYDGYVRHYCVSFSGTNGGHNTDPDFNGKIKCKDGAVCYDLVGGTYVDNGDRLADGQQIEIIGEFTKSEEYTYVRYIDEKGETQECYVLTEFVRHTEAGVYQVVMFVIAVIVAAFVIFIVILKVRRKNKID